MFDEIGERLCSYRGDADHRSVPAVASALACTELLLAGVLLVVELHGWWQDRSPVVGSLIAGHGIDELGVLLRRVPLGDDDLDRPLTQADHRFFRCLADWLSS